MALPIEKTHVMSLDRASAQNLICANLYETFFRELGTTNINIIAEAGRTESSGKWVPFSRNLVPHLLVPLTSIFSPTYDEFKVSVKYSYVGKGLDPRETLTRMDFVMQTIQIWERLIKSSHSDVPIAAIELLKATYTLEEMLPDMDSFKALFAESKEDASGISE